MPKPLRLIIFGAALFLALLSTAAFAQRPSSQSTGAPVASQVTAQPLSATTAAPAAQGLISGTVKSGNTPLPGVSITAVNSLTGKKIFTSTQSDGRFTIHVPGRGRWIVRAELPAFAAETKEIIFTPETLGTPQTVALDMVLASRRQKEDQQAGDDLQQLAGAVIGRGMQTLGLSQSEGETSGATQSVN